MGLEVSCLVLEVNGKGNNCAVKKKVMQQKG